MSISGFTMVRNADKFYFPIKESIMSILPIVDEFVIALDPGDEDDRTEELIKSIGSEKIKIVYRRWDEKSMIDGQIYADETNVALDHCTGDWCFYLQADECIHEQDHQEIVNSCEKYLDDKEVDGLLFKYNHFWGDYDHYLPFRGWYRNEIRCFKNNRNIYSFKDAQSFRRKTETDDSKKLNVTRTNVKVFHYGWVRPPYIMQSKKKEQDEVHYKTKEKSKASKSDYDYGALGALPTFKDSHPAIMKNWIDKHNWKDKLNYTTTSELNRDKFKHEKLKYRIISWIENNLFGRKTIMGYKNWRVIR